MTDIRKYIVGGFVRDQIRMGSGNHKDIDYAVEAESFDAMREWIIGQFTSPTDRIFEDRPEFSTIRARIGRETFDYVMCRRDGAYSDGRHPDEVFAGTIDDDLARRDFTMNAIAICEDGSYYDPFGGIADIEAGIIRCVGNAEDRMREDFLRLMRAARFSITKGMAIHNDIVEMFGRREFVDGLRYTVSSERIREEVAKMFQADTERSIVFFAQFPMMRQAVFGTGQIWMQATSAKR